MEINMANQSNGSPVDILENVSREAKNFYSAGSTFSAFACSGVVRLVWAALDRVYAPLESELTALVLSFVIVYTYAVVIPEPHNYANPGEMKLTLPEILFGFFNSFIVFALAIAIKNL
jgi:hypothetical protein